MRRERTIVNVATIAPDNGTAGTGYKMLREQYKRGVDNCARRLFENFRDSAITPDV
jgi:hypothetical protein